MPTFKLLSSNLRARPVRTALTVASVALAVSLVVAVTTGYASAEKSIFHYLESFLGATDAQIVNGSDWQKGMPTSLVNTLRADPDVVRVFGRLEAAISVLDKEGQYIPTPAAELVGIDRPHDDDITRAPLESGQWFDTDTGDVAVIDQRAAEILKVSVGQFIILPGPNPGDKRKFTVVGIFRKPGFIAERIQTLYIPLKTAERISNRPGEITRIMIRLKSPALTPAFAARFDPILRAIDPALKMRTAQQTRTQMEHNLQGMHFLSSLGGAVSLVSAAFIVFSTLSMGVSERQRTLAMLRAIGAYRTQIARVVLAEGLFLALAGALLGVPLGILWAKILTLWQGDFFTAGLAIDSAGIYMGILGAGAAALLAGVIPAYTASRVSPLEAMTPLARPGVLRTAALCALLGLLLVSLDTLSIFRFGPSREFKFAFHFAAGLPATILGAFLIAPLVVRIIGLALTRPVAALLRIQPRLLRQQLSGGLWRAAGTASALMVGLAILVVLQTVGHSMLNGWKLPTKFPDIFIFTANQQLKASETSQLEAIKGIKKGEVTPLILGMPGFEEGFLNFIGMAAQPEATMFIGVDPDRALNMMELEFREGDLQTARQALKQGRCLIITEELSKLKDLHVRGHYPSEFIYGFPGVGLHLRAFDRADSQHTLSLMTRRGLVRFIICGVVRSPGIDVMVSMFDLRGSIDQRSAFSVFGSLADAKDKFGWERAYLFCANLEPATDREALLKSIKTQLGDRGWKAGDTRKIKAEITKGFSKALLLITTVAFAAMAVAAMGVANTLMASVRSRQWQFGILRAIGVTRAQLLRLVIAESLMLAAVGAVLGLAVGFLVTLNAMGLSNALIGYAPPITPPWKMLGFGTGIIFAVSLLASLWPATSVARAQPLTLLQAGRSAA